MVYWGNPPQILAARNRLIAVGFVKIRSELFYQKARWA